MKGKYNILKSIREDNFWILYKSNKPTKKDKAEKILRLRLTKCKQTKTMSFLKKYIELCHNKIE